MQGYSIKLDTNSTISRCDTIHMRISYQKYSMRDRWGAQPTSVEQLQYPNSKRRLDTTDLTISIIRITASKWAHVSAHFLLQYHDGLHNQCYGHNNNNNNIVWWHWTSSLFHDHHHHHCHDYYYYLRLWKHFPPPPSVTTGWVPILSGPYGSPPPRKHQIGPNLAPRVPLCKFSLGHWH